MAGAVRTILVVEDERIVAKDLQQTLVGFGYLVPHAVASADEAIRTAGESCPDLVLMDIHLKDDGDGIAAAEILRRDFDLPVIFLTAYADPDTITRAAATSPHGYLVKPVKPEELHGAVAVALQRHAMDRRIRDREHEVMLADRLSSLGTMAAGIAHEINNPLAVVVANGALAGQELADLQASLATLTQPELADRLGELAGMVGDIRESAERAAKIVGDLRTFSRPREDGSRVVDVRDAIEWALRMTEPQLRARTTIVRDLAPVPPVLAAEARLGQVFVNLLAHAAHALEAPSARTRNEVHVSTSLDEAGRVVATIADNGPTMSADLRARMFEPFFRTRGLTDGSGLELAVSHGIVRSLGGTLAAFAPATGGTVFRVTLPAAATAPALAPPPPVAPALRGQIVLIDDEPLLLSSLTRVLSRDHEVHAFSNPHAALEVVTRRKDLDLVLCDLIMPGLSGIEIYERVLEVAPELAPKFVFVTGGAFTTRGKDFIASVKNPCLEKPFGPDRLREFVKEFLVTSRAAAAAATT